MSSSLQSRFLEPKHLLKFKRPSGSANYEKAKSKEVTKITFALIIASLSFSAVGCSTLQALEPTAILISDIKNSI